MVNFTEEAVRVLGSMMEKAVTTPDHYPLTLKALVTACNQKTSREPVVCYGDETVVRAVDELRDHHIAWQALSPGSRTAKYRHSIRDVIPMTDPEEAVICCLLLRGPQTIGEIRGRTSRMYDFDSLDAVADILRDLAEREEPLVRELPRQPGRKDCRWAHLLAGEPDVADSADPVPVEPARARVAQTDQRIDELTNEIAELREQMTDLKTAFQEFRSQFD